MIMILLWISSLRSIEYYYVTIDKVDDKNTYLRLLNNSLTPLDEDEKTNSCIVNDENIEIDRLIQQIKKEKEETILKSVGKGALLNTGDESDSIKDTSNDDNREIAQKVREYIKGKYHYKVFAAMANPHIDHSFTSSLSDFENECPIENEEDIRMRFDMNYDKKDRYSINFQDYCTKLYIYSGHCFAEWTPENGNTIFAFPKETISAFFEATFSYKAIVSLLDLTLLHILSKQSDDV
jgi:hypothetical protein